jgi:hypothetical protein
MGSSETVDVLPAAIIPMPYAGTRHGGGSGAGAYSFVLGQSMNPGYPVREGRPGGHSWAARVGGGAPPGPVTGRPSDGRTAAVEPGRWSFGAGSNATVPAGRSPTRASPPHHYHRAPRPGGAAALQSVTTGFHESRKSEENERTSRVLATSNKDL